MKIRLTMPRKERLLIVLPYAAEEMLKPKADEPVVAREFAVVRAAIGVPEADRVATTLDTRV